MVLGQEGLAGSRLTECIYFVKRIAEIVDLEEPNTMYVGHFAIPTSLGLADVHSPFLSFSIERQLIVPPFALD